MVLSVKNISREALNVAPERLMERFVRGDESRTTEGSGLGLSIARSLTELQGGIFQLKVDGDLFKACKMCIRDSYSRDGGYSRHDAKEAMMEQAREMMENATTDREREAIRRFMSELGRD